MFQLIIQLMRKLMKQHLMMLVMQTLMVMSLMREKNPNDDGTAQHKEVHEKGEQLVP